MDHARLRCAAALGEFEARRIARLAGQDFRNVAQIVRPVLDALDDAEILAIAKEDQRREGVEAVTPLNVALAGAVGNQRRHRVTERPGKFRQHHGDIVAFGDPIRVTRDDGVVHYVNLLSVGFAADVGALTNRRFKPVGALGYILAVLVEVTRLAARAFPHDPGKGTDAEPVTLLSFSNTQYTGGDMRMAPFADPTDGAVDLVRIGAMGRRRLLSCFPKLFQGTHVEMEEVSSRPITRCTFAFDQPVEVMLDGEIQVLRLQELEVLPGALELWT